MAVADARAIAGVHIDSSRDAYAPLATHWPISDLDDKTETWSAWIPKFRKNTRRCDLVAEHDGEIVAFVCAGPTRAADPAQAVEVYVIHVLSLHRGLGIGGQLLQAASEYTRGPQLHSMCVNTFAELQCCSFYERHGATVFSDSPADYHGGSVTKRVYVWREGQVLRAAPR